MIDTVVVATDGSESVGRAIDTALDLAERFDADVHALSVVDTGALDTTPDDLRTEMADALAARAEDALANVAERADGPVTTAVREGRPADEILAYVREIDADVVATGTRGRHGENRLLIGSVAERVVRDSPIPVLTVRRLETDEIDGRA
ncbi:universal stress protein [Halarchaeum nitratireducens]|uniref:Universal stress protein UspA n=1 Tax=Halarchaeum nitratireducens TaxID=489913 RepID=A0A830GA42_9EURY|nr:MULTISPECIES: universal stress protein [Halarchaeum]MBP2250228.1 nucleotide-binding universal stress UspA family protein [Halarchaeum solikamskense]GGN12152.1 universal stress protein UspA [Halarchaeum nitratireducens]